MGTLHHLDVGCADASVIKTSNATFLVDCHNIDQYSHLLPANKNLRGVFITHQHHDHYSGLKFLRRNGYSIDCLVYSPYQRRHGDSSVTSEEWNEFNSLKDYFEGQGTKLYPKYKQDNFDKPWWETNGVSFWMLGPARAIADRDTRELHDASLVFQASMGGLRCLFTGDASDTNLEYVANTDNICNGILHASHHGSLEGASLSFIKKCNATSTVISTEAGVHENVPHPTSLQRYTEHTKGRVYRTDKNGSLKWEF